METMKQAVKQSRYSWLSGGYVFSVVVKPESFDFLSKIWPQGQLPPKQ